MEGPSVKQQHLFHDLFWLLKLTRSTKSRQDDRYNFLRCAQNKPLSTAKAAVREFSRQENETTSRSKT